MFKFLLFLSLTCLLEPSTAAAAAGSPKLKAECSTLIGRGLSRLCSDWLHLSDAINTQLKALKAPYQGYFLPFTVSLWHKGGFHAWKGFIIGAFMPYRNT